MSERTERLTDGQMLALTKSGNCLVSASAGSGKTTVMIKRIIRYLRGGGSINKIVVITFTRAAAAEIKEKLLDGLYGSIRKGEGNAAHLRKQIRGLNFAYVSTIDGFCAELYRRYFEDVGGSPDFSMLEPSESAALFRQACDSVVEEYTKANDEAFVKLAEIFIEKRKLEPLYKALEEINGFVSVQKDGVGFLDTAEKIAKTPPRKTPAARAALEEFRKRAGELSFECAGLEGRIDLLRAYDIFPKNFLSGIHEAKNSLASIGAASSLRNMCLFLLDTGSVTKNNGVCEWPYDELRLSMNDFYDEYRKLIAEAKDMFEDGGYADLVYKEKIAAASVLKLAEIARRAIIRYGELKRKNGKTDFPDIERLALAVLGNADRAAEIREGLDYIFLDEYQDTNYLQEEIMKGISREDNVYMVGDVKQSIYGFRHAEPRIFIEKSKEYGRGKRGNNISMNDNFRSSANVIQFINRVFDQVMVEKFGDIDYKGTARLIKGVDFPVSGDLPSVKIAFFEERKDDGKKAAVGQPAEDGNTPAPYKVTADYGVRTEDTREAEYIADRIESIVGNVEIYDVKTEAMRPARYDDIAILTRDSGDTLIIAELKSRNIPVHAPGFGNAGGYKDIDIIISLLDILDNYMNDIPLYASMLSYFGGFTESELQRIRNRKKDCFFWEAVRDYGEEDGIKEKISVFFRMITKYKNLSAVMPAGALISKIITDTGFDGYLIAQPEKERIEYVNSFIFSVKNAANCERPSDVRGFYGSFGADAAPAGENAVIMTTVHKSKGLEFPIVFVARCNHGFFKKKITDKDIIIDSRLGLLLKSIDSEGKKKSTNMSTKIAFLNAERKGKEELLRLMYVAMTRARYHLFLTGYGSSGNKKRLYQCENFLHWTEYAAEKDGAFSEYYETDFVPSAAAREKRPSVPRRKALPVQIAFDYPYKESSAVGNKYTVSALNAEKMGERPQYIPKLEHLGNQNTQKGNAYHKIMELIGFERRPESQIREEIRAIAEREKLDGVNPEHIINVLNSELFDTVRAGECKREMPFLLYLPANGILDTEARDKVLTQGVIDLLVVGEKGNLLIDYKVSGAPLEEIRERYSEQLRIYALAAEKLLGVKPDKKIICVLNRNEIIECV